MCRYGHTWLLLYKWKFSQSVLKIASCHNQPHGFTVIVQSAGTEPEKCHQDTHIGRAAIQGTTSWGFGVLSKETFPQLPPLDDSQFSRITM